MNANFKKFSYSSFFLKDEALSIKQMEMLYKSERDSLYAYLCSLLDPVSAQDALQTSFEKAFKKSDTYSKALGSRKAWLYSIAKNTALDELRRAKRQAIPQAQLPETQRQAADGVRDLDLMKYLKELSLDERELIVLKYWADLSNTEISEIVQLSVSNVSTKTNRILEKLKEQITS